VSKSELFDFLYDIFIFHNQNGKFFKAFNEVFVTKDNKQAYNIPSNSYCIQLKHTLIPNTKGHRVSLLYLTKLDFSVVFICYHSCYGH